MSSTLAPDLAPVTEVGSSHAATTGPAIIEIGLRYRPGHGIPARPHSWPVGAVRLASGVLTVSYWDGKATIIPARAGRPVTISGLVRPRGLSRTTRGTAVVAQPSIGRLTELSPSGQVIAEVTLAGVRPWFATRWIDAWLISDDVNKAVFLASLDGGTVQRLPLPFTLRSVRSAVPVSDDAYLLCDRESQQAVVVSRAGEALWSFGRFGHPSAEPGCLASPEHALPAPFGVVVADTRNHRVLAVATSGEPVWSIGGPGQVGTGDNRLWQPISLSRHGDALLITDAGNNRVVEVSLADGVVRRTYGDGTVVDGLFHFPRSLTAAGTTFTVADSYNNRISRFHSSGRELLHVTTALDLDLFWPRFAAVIDGTLVVSDSRNGRVILSAGGGRWRELKLSVDGRKLRLIDPHAVHRTPFGWLLTDTGLNAALLFEPRTGAVAQIWSGTPVQEDLRAVAYVPVPVDDLHDAVLDSGRDLWFANTGSHSITRLKYTDGTVTDVTPRWASGAPSAFDAPRSVDLYGDELIVADSGNHRVLAISRTGIIQGVYGRRRGHAVDCLSNPRFARMAGDRIAVADYLNDRVLLLPRAAMGGTDPGTSEELT